VAETIDLSIEERAALDQLSQAAERRDLYALLGVNPKANAEDIQKAFYERSRRWHPDRFFRRELGEYREKLDQVFVTTTEAYRILSDGESRSRYDATRSPARPAPAPSTADSGSEKPKARVANRALDEMRNQLKERLAKAKQLHVEGMAALAEGNVMKASSALSLAMTYDPQNLQYKKDAEVARKKARLIQAKQFVTAAENAESFANHKEALSNYLKAIEFGLREARPFYRAGLLVKKIDDDTKGAIQHLRNAVSLEPNNIEYRQSLGDLYLEVGLGTSARAQFEHILTIDKSNAKAKEGLKAIQ
jgi:curved DNA-binding protein CbpA